MKGNDLPYLQDYYFHFCTGETCPFVVDWEASVRPSFQPSAVGLGSLKVGEAKSCTGLETAVACRVFQYFHFDTAVKYPFAAGLVELALSEASFLGLEYPSWINLPFGVQD